MSKITEVDLPSMYQDFLHKDLELRRAQALIEEGKALQHDVKKKQSLYAIGEKYGIGYHQTNRYHKRYQSIRKEVEANSKELQEEKASIFALFKDRESNPGENILTNQFIAMKMEKLVSDIDELESEYIRTKGER